MGAELAFEEAFFFDCFFLAVRFGTITCFLRDTFFRRFEAAVLDFVCLLLVFFFLEGMAAVYHRGHLTAHLGRQPRACSIAP